MLPKLQSCLLMWCLNNDFIFSCWKEREVSQSAIGEQNVALWQYFSKLSLPASPDQQQRLLFISKLWMTLKIMRSRVRHGLVGLTKN